MLPGSNRRSPRETAVRPSTALRLRVSFALALGALAPGGSGPAPGRAAPPLQPIGPLNRASADSIAVDELWPGGASGLGLRGEGLAIGLWDEGPVRASHVEFGGRAVAVENVQPASDHATHVAATLIAAGIDPRARGVADRATVRAFDWDDDAAELLAEAMAGNVIASNHSYGERAGWWLQQSGAHAGWVWSGDPAVDPNVDFHFGLYDADAEAFDQVAVAVPNLAIVVAAGDDRGEGPALSEQPVPHVHADATYPALHLDVHAQDGAASAGFRTIADRAVAKNVLTVGALGDAPGGARPLYVLVQDEANAPPGALAAALLPTSSFGPTADGRIKPEVVADGRAVYSASAGSDHAYATASGTSSAAAFATGTVALLIERWRDVHGGASPRSATVKAILAHSAVDDATLPGPDYAFGFGAIDAMAALAVIARAAADGDVVLEQSIADGELLKEWYAPAAGSAPLKVTLAWTDPAGAALMNDLDLRLFDPAGAEYRPLRPDPAAPELPAQAGDDALNVIEQVVVAAPAAGPWRIAVTAKGPLRGGGAGGARGLGTQPFTLVRSGFLRSTIGSVPAGLPPAPGPDLLGPALEVAISADGRAVAFTSASAALAPGDANGQVDVFVHDRATGATVRASAAPAGAIGNGASGEPALSADGRTAAFSSTASDLVPGDGNGARDVFVRDLASGALVLASAGLGGIAANGPSERPALSADGRYVAFVSLASNLVAGDGNGKADVFRFDRQTGATVRASAGAGATEANDASTRAAISADGSRVAFVSRATNLAPSDPNGLDDVFLRDLASGTTLHVSVDAGGGPADNSSLEVALDGAGRFVAFSSYANDLVAGDANLQPDVFVRDLALALTVMATSGGGPNWPETWFFEPTISLDGRFVAFSSVAPDLVPEDGDFSEDSFVRDLLTGAIERVDVSGAGAAAATGASHPRISGDGRFVAFSSAAPNLVPADLNPNGKDVFLHDRHSGDTVQVDQASAAPLAIAAQPQDVDGCAGAVLAQNVVKSAAPALFQWRKDGVPLSGANAPNLALVGASAAGAYDVVLTTTGGSLASDPAVATVATAPAFWLEPEGTAAVVGGTEVLRAGALGWPALTFQWRKDGQPLAESPGRVEGTATPELTLSQLGPGDAGSYDLVVANACGAAASAPVVVTVGAVVCQQDLGFGGPGTLFQQACGGDLATGHPAALQVSGAPAGAPLLLFLSPSSQPTFIPALGGTLVSLPVAGALPFAASALGELSLQIRGGLGALSIYAQWVAVDALVPNGYAVSNALRIDLLP